MDEGQIISSCLERPRNEVPDTLDAEIFNDAQPFFKDGEKMQLSYTVRNTLRTIGARTSSRIVQRFGMNNSLQSDHLTIKLNGSAGQSLGAFAVNGLKIEVAGDANDYVGKGLSGGMITLRPPLISNIKARENVIIGNTVLYGATGGSLYAAGRAGERFCVRNSGAEAVVEGCGANGCEYMTGGVAMILGSIGNNFGAGMTGGMAYLYDPHGLAVGLMNLDTLMVGAIASNHWMSQCMGIVQRHAIETESETAAAILDNWMAESVHFIQVCPKEMVSRLSYPLEWDAIAKSA